jgi:hypothetical protein
MQARLLIKIYAAPYEHFRIPKYVQAHYLVPISPGTVGEILSQIIHPTTNIVITTVQFGDLYADIGLTAWEYVT